MSLLSSAQYITSVADGAQLNAAALAMLPEVAFVGRSNAGKSSTINLLTRQRQLAYASKTPGRTQMLNFFELSEKDAAGERVARGYLVDLPGYGFAKVDDETRLRWDQLVGGYLQSRRLLRGVLLIMDARHPLKPADEELMAWLAGREQPETLRLHLVLNKADQLKTMAKRAALALAEQRAESLPMPTSVQLLSTLKRDGVEELEAVVREMIAS